MKTKTFFLALFCSLQMFAAGVNLTGIACSNQTVTVSCTACGIAQYQGFSIQGSSVPTYNLNSTAATASANSFTFTLPAATACAGSATGGTVQPAKQIINISSAPQAGGYIAINYVFWNTTTTPFPLACTLPPDGKTCPVSLWSGASAAENAAIVAGTTVETAGTVTIAATVASATVSTNLVTQYNNVQANYTSGFLKYSGYWWNGTAWVNQ